MKSNLLAVSNAKMENIELPQRLVQVERHTVATARRWWSLLPCWNPGSTQFEGITKSIEANPKLNENNSQISREHKDEGIRRKDKRVHHETQKNLPKLEIDQR
ncbi:hypothetical protein FRC12_009588 [Ceratobasidium sp. 428]|nr:hypothetical protein FRC12_009588 [Ceratobasidium sp. 428]